MRPFDLLIRLQRRRLDEVRIALRESAEQLERLHRASAGTHRRAVEEAEAVRSDPRLAPDLAAFLGAQGQKRAELAEQAVEVAAARAQQLAALQDQRIEVKRLELLAARAGERRARECARRDERELADLILAQDAGGRRGR